MCGIFGYAGTEVVPSLLETMGKYSLHRGPDDIGYYQNSEARVYFGLRRLSIIDLSTGHQPIPNEDKTIWIVCNGEIYNYTELRKDLIEKGHRFRTHSDVEVLVHLYEEYGLDFLSNVNGMFGLAIFDSSSNRLILARDRLGIKPVYYAWDGKRLAFASEIKPILLCPWISRDPDWQAISSYLHLLYVPFPRTGFKQVYKLESGTIAVLEDEALRFIPYWRLNSFLGDHTKRTLSFADAASSLQSLLEDACRLQLRSDVPVGAFLSGGMDSSAVVALSNKDEKLDMDTFTVFWQNAPEKMDERLFAQDVAKKYHCTYHETSLSFDDFDRLLPLLVWHLEEPNADGAYVPTYIVSQFARQRAKVILTGAGGDELFGGYGWYRSSLSFLQWLIRPYLWRPEKKIYRFRTFNFPWRLVFPHYCSDAAVDFLSQCSRMKAEDALNGEMATDLKLWLQDDILMLTDKMSMAASLEARVPLLDHRIVEFALMLPSYYKITQSDTKAVFKRAVGKYLPTNILYRRKDGFGAPIHSWMSGPFEAISMDLLRRGELMKQGILTPQSLTRLEYLLPLRKSWASSLWILLNLELWFRFVQRSTMRPESLRLSEL